MPVAEKKKVSKMYRCDADLLTEGFMSHQCKNKGTVDRGGKHYCGIHDPVAQEERRQRKDQQRTAVRQADKQDRIRASNGHDQGVVLDFLDALKKDAWLADTLANLIHLTDRKERARQLVTLLAQQARGWEHRPIQ